jgi:WD40 repeat protein
LERFAKAWYRLRALRAFRDKTGLSVTPELWGSIERALESSEYFVLLASPASAQSKWVRQEVEFWLQHRSTDNLLVVLTDGNIAWDAAQNDFDWSKTDALPAVLARCFKSEPNYLDLRWARVDTDVSVRKPKFLDAIASISSTLRGVPLDDLIGEDISHYRTTRRLLRIAVVVLLILTLSALYDAYVATRARNIAGKLQQNQQNQLAALKKAEAERARQEEAQRTAEHNVATSRRLATAATALLPENRELSTLLAMEAVRISPTPESDGALRQALRTKPGSPSIFRGPNGKTVQSTAFSADGRRLLAVFEDGSVCIWTITSPLSPVLLSDSSIMYPRADGSNAVFSPDGSTVLTAPFRSLRTYLEPAGANAAAKIWDSASGQLRFELKHPYVQQAVYSPDGKRVVTVSDDDSTVIWDTGSGARLVELKDHRQSVRSVDYGRDGKLFLTAGGDDLVRIRNAVDGETVGLLRVPGKSLLSGAMFSPDSHWVLTANRDEPPRLWDWQGAPGSSAAELRGHTRPIRTAEFSPDSRLLVTAGDDHSARVWQVATGRNLFELEHDDSLSEATFSANGRWILTASIDGNAILWEASTGKRFMDFSDQHQVRTTATFSPDDSHVATGTPSGDVLLFPCDICGSLETLLALAQTRVTRTLTSAEKAKYLENPATK